MSIVAPIPHPFLTAEEQAVVKSRVTEFTRSGRFHWDSDGLPPYATQRIVGLLDLLAEGRDVRIPPTQTEVSITQAAKYLDLPESSIHGMIERESFKTRLDGDQYWIDWNSLLEYEALCQWRHEGLDEIARMSQEMGLYDMGPYDD
ncbi:MAG: hypothetical protein FWC43_08055 [Planctomycetaceae bacterium]|nr:hypothetical protein [Planctomycetaceae bacterium]